MTRWTQSHCRARLRGNTAARSPTLFLTYIAVFASVSNLALARCLDAVALACTSCNVTLFHGFVCEAVALASVLGARRLAAAALVAHLAAVLVVIPVRNVTKIQRRTKLVTHSHTSPGHCSWSQLSPQKPEKHSHLLSTHVPCLIIRGLDFKNLALTGLLVAGRGATVTSKELKIQM